MTTNQYFLPRVEFIQVSAHKLVSLPGGLIKPAMHLAFTLLKLHLKYICITRDIGPRTGAPNGNQDDFVVMGHKGLCIAALCSKPDIAQKVNIGRGLLSGF